MYSVDKIILDTESYVQYTIYTYIVSHVLCVFMYICVNTLFQFNFIIKWKFKKYNML